MGGSGGSEEGLGRHPWAVCCPHRGHHVQEAAVGLGSIQLAAGPPRPLAGAGDTSQARRRLLTSPLPLPPAPRPSSRSRTQGCLGPCRTSRRTSPSLCGTSMSTCLMMGSSRSMSFPSGGRKTPQRGTCHVSYGCGVWGRPCELWVQGVGEAQPLRHLGVG